VIKLDDRKISAGSTTNTDGRSVGGSYPSRSISSHHYNFSGAE